MDVPPVKQAKKRGFKRTPHDSPHAATVSTDLIVLSSSDEDVPVKPAEKQRKLGKFYTRFDFDFV